MRLAVDEKNESALLQSERDTEITARKTNLTTETLITAIIVIIIIIIIAVVVVVVVIIIIPFTLQFEKIMMECTEVLYTRAHTHTHTHTLTHTHARARAFGHYSIRSGLAPNTGI